MKHLETKMSRTTDTNNGKGVAVKTANDWGADLVISVHCNSFTDTSVKGAETLVQGLGGKAEQFAGKVNLLVAEAMQTANRGVKVQNVEILRETNAPAVLIEIGFISNAEEESKLNNSTYQNRVAEAVTKACCEYFGVKEDKTMDYKGHWAQNSIDKVIAAKIMIGDGKGNFRPNDNLTRAEAATIIAKVVESIK
jgi:N-acetylmuramoyl-L-alanine amidase